MRTQMEEKAWIFLNGGPATSLELAEHLGCAQSTARGILMRWNHEGLVDVKAVRHRGIKGGSGGPKYVYAIGVGSAVSGEEKP